MYNFWKKIYVSFRRGFFEVVQATVSKVFHGPPGVLICRRYLTCSFGFPIFIVTY